MFGEQLDFKMKTQMLSLLSKEDLKKLETTSIQLDYFEKVVAHKKLFYFVYYIFDTPVHFYINDLNYKLSMQIIVPDDKLRVQTVAINLGKKIRSIIIKRIMKIPQFMFLPQSRDIEFNLILR